ncbi:hypothetical protein ACN38_g5376 [Penicillium nordicum]|uniref:Uncharacterized protein n=1 Tax=Penicillium nordicum TaxID=229535 RepID=A0A0M8P1U2_9EURO|nr:hypothetical protein ACN38_g5376 [Penicillium nordicum]
MMGDGIIIYLTEQSPTVGCLRHQNVIEPPCMIALSLLSFSSSSPLARLSIHTVFSPFHFRLDRIAITNN